MRLHYKKWLVVSVIFPLLINVLQVSARGRADLRAEKHSKTAKQEMSEHTEDLRALMLTLYHQNAGELAKSTQVSEREMTEWVFDGKANWKFDGIRRQQSTQAIALVFDPDFTGDHILALVVGVETLLFDAYGSTNEFDVPAVQEAQKKALASCELQGLLQKISSQAAIEKSSSVLAQSHSSQQIQSTLYTIIKRINANTAEEPGFVCLDTLHAAH